MTTPPDPGVPDARESAPSQALTAPSDARLTSARQLELAAGGRRALVEALLPAIRTKDQEVLVGLLDDPRHDHLPLAALLDKARIPLAALLSLYAEAKLTRARTASQLEVAEQLPRVAKSVMERGVPHKRDCLNCGGEGTVVPNPTPEHPNPSPLTCPACNGYGTVVWTPAPAHEKLALELGGMLTKAPGVSVSVNQQTLVAGGSFAETVDALTRVSDVLVYGADRGRGRSARGRDAEGSAPIDAEVVPPPPATPPGK